MTEEYYDAVGAIHKAAVERELRQMKESEEMADAKRNAEEAAFLGQMGSHDGRIPAGRLNVAPELPLPIPGWFARENREQLGKLIAEHNIKSVVEVGSFLGLSAVWFAQRVDSVHCVDTWYEGATYESDNNLVGTLRKWGYPVPFDFFPLFRENVMRSGYWHKINPIKGGSHHVVKEVPHADLIYLDAGHAYGQVYQDICDYRDKARVILCGDDYTKRMEVDKSGPCFGVIEAVKELLPDHQHAGPFWWAVRGKDGGF